MWKRLARLLRHRWRDDARLRRAFPPGSLERLAAHVAASERLHSGEICIHVEAGLPWGDLWRDATPRERAVALFGELGVWDTEEDNGVLIYLLLAEHAIEVVADRGLMRRVPQPVWDGIVTGMGDAFHEGRFAEGLERAVDTVSELLVAHFPLAAGQHNPNELPDAPVVRGG